MKIAVLKFGGTSVSTPEGRGWAYAHINDAFAKGYAVTVVVSAMGRKGDEYATDTLLSLVTPGHSDKRELDLLMSCGEVISSVVLSSFLRSKGLLTVPLTGLQAGIKTDGKYGNGRIVGVDTGILMGLMLMGKIPLVTGFQGYSGMGEIVTLGRGGSDLTAIALASYLGAESVEIYKDVDGVMTSDPKVNPEARAISRISLSRLLDMINAGSRLMHREAVMLAANSLVEFRLRNTFSNGEGTLVTPYSNDIMEVVD